MFQNLIFFLIDFPIFFNIFLIERVIVLELTIKLNFLISNRS